MEPMLRVATEEDLQNILPLHKACFEDHPKTEYLCPRRHDHPYDYDEAIWDQYREWLRDETGTWQVNLVEVLDKDIVSLVGVSVWRWRPDGKSEQEARKEWRAIRNDEKTATRFAPDIFHMEIEGMEIEGQTETTAATASRAQRAARGRNANRALLPSSPLPQPTVLPAGERALRPRPLTTDHIQETRNIVPQASQPNAASSSEDDDDNIYEPYIPTFTPTIYNARRDACPEHYQAEKTTIRDVLVSSLLPARIKPRYHLELLGTHPEYRDHGIGEMAMVWGLGKAKDTGTYVTTYVSARDGKDYLKMGWKKLAHHTMQVEGKEENYEFGVFYRFPAGENHGEQLLANTASEGYAGGEGQWEVDDDDGDYPDDGESGEAEDGEEDKDVWGEQTNMK